MDSVLHLKWVKDKKNSLKKKPQIYTFSSIKGWNSWNHFGCSINETIVRKTVDAIIATGLAAAGYEYGMCFFLLLYILIIIFCSKFG
jgi:hypothetical protein